MEEDKYIVTYFQNEIAVRRFPEGHTLKECKKKVIQHYRETIDYISGLDENEFLDMYTIDNRHGHK